MPSVAVFGTGPAGMAIAYSAINHGLGVTLISRDRYPSEIHGCQYLQQPIIDGHGIHSAVVAYRLIGTPEQYREKAWGGNGPRIKSPEDPDSTHHAWDIRETYKYLWEYVARVARFHEATISWKWISRNRKWLGAFDYVISTIPVVRICYGISGHSFKSIEIIAAGSRDPVFPDDSAIVIADGTDANSWYRKASVFGYETTEWTIGDYSRDLVRAGLAVKVRKPLSTNCDCWPWIIRMGRYGKWDKSQLVHSAYNEAEELFNGE